MHESEQISVLSPDPLLHPHAQFVRTIDQQLYQQLYNGNVNQFFVIQTYSEADYRTMNCIRVD